MIQSEDMYKNLIIGLALMFIFAGAHYINKAGGGELLEYMVSGEKPTTLTPLNSANIPGVYVCDGKSGCDSKYVLLLRDDQSAEMIFIPTDTENSEEGAENTTNSNNSDTTSSSVITEPKPDQPDESQPNSESGIGGGNETATSSVPSETVDTSTTVTPTEEFFDSAEDSNQTDEETSTSNKDKGTWDVAVQNMLVINFVTQGTTTYEIPQKIVIKNVGTNTLSKISYTKSNYIEMINPVFIKQE